MTSVGAGGPLVRSSAAANAERSVTSWTGVSKVARAPCFKAFRRDRRFPSQERGPVLASQGLVRCADSLKVARPLAVSPRRR